MAHCLSHSDQPPFGEPVRFLRIPDPDGMFKLEMSRASDWDLSIHKDTGDGSGCGER